MMRVAGFLIALPMVVSLIFLTIATIPLELFGDIVQTWEVEIYDLPLSFHPVHHRELPLYPGTEPERLPKKEQDSLLSLQGFLKPE